MNDCSYTLFDALMARYPYEPVSGDALKTLRRFQAIQPASIPPELRDTFFELRDSLDILGYYKAHHAFLLGLDFGLSLSHELNEPEP